LKKIASLSRLHLNEDGSLEFEFVYADGTSDVFKVDSAKALDFSAQMSAASLARAPEDMTIPKFHVAFEAGTGRVFLGLTPGGGGQLSLILTQDVARNLGSQLTEAARKARKPVRKS
jgi:hypothetical protein